MPPPNDWPVTIAMDSSRKLTEGERVEVRQKEVGLRGSWHPGVVAKVKDGRRIVEYDELLSHDGKKKLQEVITLQEDCAKTSIPVDHTVRGFIRPLPPVLCLSSVRSPKKGLLIDAFYDYAWWEGVLLHDVLTKNKDMKVKILFPEEGDELLCPIKDIRVSQEWNEMSGHWMVRGSWSSCDKNGELDIDCLRSMCRQKWSVLKKLWRQKAPNVSSVQRIRFLKPGGSRLGTAIAVPSLRNVNKGININNDSEQNFGVIDIKCETEATDNAQRSSKDVSGGRLLKSFSPTKLSLKESQSAAKKFLLDTGWKIGFRIRKAGISQGVKYTVYTAPNGSKYYSISSACRSWKKSKNLPKTEEGKSQRLKLLDAYNLAEQFFCPVNGRKKPKLGHLMERQKHKIWKQKGRGFHISGVGANLRRPAKMVCGKSEDFTNNAIDVTKKSKKRKFVDESTELKSKAPFYTEKPRKNRCNDGPEQKCKESRSLLKHKILIPESKASLGGGGCKMQVLLSSPGRHKNSKKGQSRTDAAYLKRSTVLSWLVDKGILKDSENVRYLSRRDGHVMKIGAVTREGILCKCCKSVFTLSNFEAHAGSKLHRPSANIFLDDGRSITDCQLQACALQDAKEDNLADVSDDICGVCADGGELILCDHCPSTFHPSCIGLEAVPDGDWYCPRCSCGGCGQKRADGSQTNAMYQCDQCELGYHAFCVPKFATLKAQERAKGVWFCGHQCEQIFTALRNLVGRVNLLDHGYSWMVLRSTQNDKGLSPSGLEMMAEHNVKLGVAHDVMQECFIPMIDPRTKINLISQALYNRRSRVSRLDYGGFYTIVLEKGDEIITVATFRVHGAKLAEMPLVGTRYQYRRQGMCRRLMRALEQMLESIGVNKLVLPAVPELLETWTAAFHFQHMTAIETQELSQFKLMTFPGTTILQKQMRKELVVLPTTENIDKLHRNEPVVAKFVADAGFGSTKLRTSSGYYDLCKRKEVTFFCEKKSHWEGSSLNVHCSESNTHTIVEGLNSFVDLEENRTAKTNDGVQSGRVVRATTRSKRLIKSSQWIANEREELSKSMDLPTWSAVFAGNSQKYPELNLSWGTSFPSNQISDSHNPVSNVDNAGFDFSPVHYTRRRRSKKHEDENDSTMIDCH